MNPQNETINTLEPVLFTRISASNVGKTKMLQYQALTDFASFMIGVKPKLTGWEGKAIRRYINRCVECN